MTCGRPRWVSYLETGRSEATVAECKAFAEACGFRARLITGRPGAGMDLLAVAEGRPDADLEMAADLLRLLPSISPATRVTLKATIEALTAESAARAVR